MKRKKSKAVAEAEKLERVRVEWNESASPENIAKLRSEMMANADPERRRRLEELAELAKKPHESAQAQFARVFGKIDTAERMNTLSRMLHAFASEHASGQIRDVVGFIRDKRKKGSGKGGDNAAGPKRKTANASKQRSVARFKELIATGERDADESLKMMQNEGWSRATLYRHLADELKRLGRGRRKPVKRAKRPLSAK